MAEIKTKEGRVRHLKPALRWLFDALANGERPTDEIKEAATLNGFSVMQLRKAKADLGVTTVKCDGSAGFTWYWRLPGSPQDRDDEALAGDLLTAIRSREDQRPYSQTETVAWVAEYLKDRIGTLEPDDIPNGAALSMLLWAKKDEDAFRQMYDAKRMERPEPIGKAGGKRRLKGPGSNGQDTIARLMKGAAADGE